MARDSTLTVPLLLALGLHIALFCYARFDTRTPHVPPITRQEDAPPRDALIWVEVPALQKSEQEALQPTSPGAALARASSAGYRGRASNPEGQSSDLFEAEPQHTHGEASDIAREGDENDSSSKSAPTERKLSLNELGIGEQNPFIVRQPSQPSQPTSPRQQGIARFRHSIVDAGARADQARGLGPEGPVLKEIEQAVYASSLPLETSATWVVITDKHGNVINVEVTEATTDKRLWDELARKSLAALKKQRLRVAKNPNGVRLQFLVSSKNLMPSGRDPGLTTTLFGIPISEGEGKRSTRLEILNPLPRLEVSPSVPGQPQAPKVEWHFNLLAIDGDPADIGSRPKRMVHARLQQLWLYPCVAPQCP